MKSVGIALGALSMLPDQRVADKERVKKEKRKNEIALKKKQQVKVKEGLSKEQEIIKRERIRVGNTINDLNSRLSVFDEMLLKRSASPVREVESVASPLSYSSPEQSESEEEDAQESEILTKQVDTNKLPAHSPQRFRHIYEKERIPTITEYEQAHHVLKDREKLVYHMRLDFWKNDEVRRLQGYCGFTDHQYGKEQIYLELQVPALSTPYDLINAILKAWNWDNSHVYRFSSNTGNGSNLRKPLPDSQRHYEAEAFYKDRDIPHLDAFCLKQFSDFLIEYDPDTGNHWSWEGTVKEVEKGSHLDHVVVRERGGPLPCQYAYQLMERYIDPPVHGYGSSEEKDSTSGGKSNLHSGHDVGGKYYQATKERLNKILLSRYKDAPHDHPHLHHGKVTKRAARNNGEEEGEGEDSESESERREQARQALYHMHDGRMKARGRCVSSGLAY